jgi:hypothetical protein
VLNTHPFVCFASEELNVVFEVDRRLHSPAVLSPRTVLR